MIKNLKELDNGDEILEVGGGILALAVQLASEGFKITTVEPVGDGFSGISFMMQRYQELAQDENLPISLINMPIEQCSFNQKFKFIFSINVMEHLSDPYSVLIQLTEHLRADGKYRFFCPNYDFPYEPHFAKWMFTRTNGSFRLRVNRARTEILSPNESAALFRSLNFLTVHKILDSLRNRGVEIEINKNASYELLLRTLVDSELRKRLRILTFVVYMLDILGIIKLTKLLPRSYQPVMDVEVTLKNNIFST